jgi:hypothetical protein
MNGFTSRICETKTLLTLGLLTLIMTGLFGLVMHVSGFMIIDELYSAPIILSHISQLSPYQTTVHIWMTATLDVAYPFAYGFLFIGITLRAFAKYRIWLIFPSIAVIPIDLMEGIVQILLLLGNEQFVVFKTVLTPLKLILFSCGFVISILGLIYLVLGWRKN